VNISAKRSNPGPGVRVPASEVVKAAGSASGMALPLRPPTQPAHASISMRLTVTRPVNFPASNCMGEIAPNTVSSTRP